MKLMKHPSFKGCAFIIMSRFAGYPSVRGLTAIVARRI
jgi:hypothetical protein